MNHRAAPAVQRCGCVVPFDALPVETEIATDRDADTGFGRVASVAVVVGIVAAVIAGATMWLLVTDPVTVANAVEDGDISPLVRQLAQVIVDALAGLLQYL